MTLRTTSTLSEEDIWSDAGVSVWKAAEFVGCPSFYPVYRYHDYYSYSVVNLIRQKGCLELNQRFVAAAQRSGRTYHSGVDTIDGAIARVGGPIETTRTVRTRMDYAEQMAAALTADVQAVEALHPDGQHAVMCGGKDSLNILLLPWRSRLTVLSAAPNYALVKDFVAMNGLPHEVLQLTDIDRSTRQQEILYNACSNNLEHCRWTGELKAFADRCGKRVVVWKGQMADVFTTPAWREYCHGRTRFTRFYGRRIESRLHQAQPRYLEDRFFRAVWSRGAMWQGAHMSMLRSVTGALFVSAYHGRRVTQLLSNVDLPSAVTDDIRPTIGRILHGSDVRYPNRNPGPPRSAWRRGLSGPEHFLSAFRELVGLPIITE